MLLDSKYWYFSLLYFFCCCHLSVCGYCRTQGGKVVLHGNEPMVDKATVVTGKCHQCLQRRGWGMCSYMNMVGAKSHFGICLVQV